MFKLIILTSLIVMSTATTCNASGIDADSKLSIQDKAELNIERQNQNSSAVSNDGLKLGDEASAELLFGLDKGSFQSREIPADESKDLGLGVGLNLEF